MNNIFEIKSEKQIIFNLKNFLINQRKINNHFPNPNRDRNYITVFDTMCGQISEEVYETKQQLKMNLRNIELINNNIYQTHDSIEEFVDSLMFIGSLLIETEIYYNLDLDKLLDELKLSYIKINNKYIENALYDRNLPHDGFLSYIRRQIYDRKYHKPHTVKPDNYEENLIKFIIVSAFFPRHEDSCAKNRYEYFEAPSFIDNLNPYLQDLLFCYDNNYHTEENRLDMIPERIKQINEIINAKQNYISNL